jgi:hypothetical protein
MDCAGRAQRRRRFRAHHALEYLNALCPQLPLPFPPCSLSPLLPFSPAPLPPFSPDVLPAILQALVGLSLPRSPSLPPLEGRRSASPTLSPAVPKLQTPNPKEIPRSKLQSSRLPLWTAPAERSGDGAFARTTHSNHLNAPVPSSGSGSLLPPAPFSPAPKTPRLCG